MEGQCASAADVADGNLGKVKVLLSYDLGDDGCTVTVHRNSKCSCRDEDGRVRYCWEPAEGDRVVYKVWHFSRDDDTGSFPKDPVTEAADEFIDQFTEDFFKGSKDATQPGVDFPTTTAIKIPAHEIIKEGERTYKDIRENGL